MTILIGLVFLGVGLYLVYKFYNDYKNAKASNFWPSVSGAIVFSELEKVVRRHRHTHSRSPHMSTTVQYRPRIRYRYTLGADYEGDNVVFGMKGVSLRHNKAKAFTDRYPEGKTVEVYYDPNQPEVSVLEKGKTGYSLTGILIGGLVSLFGLGFGVWALMQGKM